MCATNCLSQVYKTPSSEAFLIIARRQIEYHTITLLLPQKWKQKDRPLVSFQ